ncbi:MAG: hypothetical protein KAT35_01910, partial [Candidatus Aenigmarchaeota archaeon]|nr:hypothetical protein [Candidatus Aenigmarchaeota archaeon]
MENRTAGYMIIAIAALIAFIVYSFNMALVDIVGSACSHGSECPMWGTLGVQTNVSIGITFFIMLIGIYLAVFGKEKPAVNRIVRPKVKLSEISRDNYDDVIKKLDSDEKPVFESVIDEKGSIFQSSIVEKTGMSKVKVTRILDRLEGRGL